MKTIFKAVALVTIFSIITRTLGFFFRIYLSRKLGPMGIGLYQMATSILGIFMTLISSGLPLTTAKMVTKYETLGETNKRDKVVSSSLIVALIMSIIASVFIFLLRNVWGIILTDNRAVEIMLILIPSIIFSAIYSIMRGALWGQNDYFNCGLTELLEQIIRFALTFIILLSITDSFIATKYSAIAFNITCLISAVIALFIYLKRGRFNFHKGEYLSLIKSATPITGVRLANSLVQPLTTIIIPTMLIMSGYTSTEAISSYGIIMGMTFPMLFVPMAIIGSISMVLIPSITSMLTKNELDSINSNITKSLEVSVFISMLFIPLYLSVGDIIGIVLYDNSFAGVLLQSSAICVLPITLCNLTGSLLNALNLEVKSFVNYLIGSTVLFISLIAFTPLVGVNSIIISFFLSMSIISLLNMRMIKKVVPSLNFDILKVSLKYYLMIIPTSTLGHFIANISSVLFNPLFSAIIGGGSSILSTIILCQIFNMYSLKDFFDIVKKKKSKSTN